MTSKNKQLEATEQDLTLKQKQFLIKYLEYGNATRAAKEVYDTDSDASAGQIGYENLKKLEKPMHMLLEKNGLDMNTLVNKLREGLEADKPFGKDSYIHPDYATQHMYVETLGKWLGLEEKTAAINLNADKVIVIPSELIDKYGISSGTKDSSK